MARKVNFKISRFENPSGKKAFRVSGSLDGQQIRKNFKTRKEAVEERDKLEIKHANGTTEGRFLWTKLTLDQHDDASAAHRLLKNSKIEETLTNAVQYFIRHYKPPKANVTLADAIEEYVDERQNDLLANALSVPQFNAIKTKLGKLGRDFPEWKAADIQTADIEKQLIDAKISPKTWNNRRGYYNTFFAFCLEKQYVAENPITKLKIHRIKRTRGTAETLSAKQTADLMEHLETYSGHEFKNGEFAGSPGCLVPYYALALFAGIRPDWKDGEISKILPSDINLETGTIHIEPTVSKNDEKRNIRIQPNLRKWLEAYPPENYPILPMSNMNRSLTDVRKKHNLSHDILRHTFISMHVGKFRSVGDAALEAGNSDSIIRKHYLDVISKEEAERFWAIEPSKAP